jgi:hypothetical protein
LRSVRVNATESAPIHLNQMPVPGFAGFLRPLPAVVARKQRRPAGDVAAVGEPGVVADDGLAVDQAGAQHR